MGIERDIERILESGTLEDIRTVAREYSANAAGPRAALYSGAIGEASASDLAVDHARRTSTSIINDTPRGRFLAQSEIESAIRASAERIFETQGIQSQQAVKLASDFLYGDAQAPKTSYFSIQNCLWCEASRDFAQSLRGDVKVIAVNADPYRVFGQVEIPTALQNPNVRTLGGVPVEALRATYAQCGVEGILPQVQAAYVREATLAGLLPPASTEVPPSVRRAPGAAFKVAARGLGAAGVAATVSKRIRTAPTSGMIQPDMERSGYVRVSRRRSELPTRTHFNMEHACGQL